MLRRSMWQVLGISTLVLAGLTTVSVAQEKKHEEKKSDEKKMDAGKDIVDTAMASADHKKLVELVKAAGLAETLKGKGPFTLFGPTDAAFGKIDKATYDGWLKPENKSKLASLLKNHVADGKHMGADVGKMKTIKTMGGAEYTVTSKDGKVMIGKATVTKADVACSNGVIHVVDMVLMPEEKAGGH